MNRALIASLLLLAGCGGLRDLERELIFLPDSAQHTDVGEVEGLETWWLEVEGGQVEAWYLPPIEPPPEGERGGAVIFAHGNAERIEGWVERLRPYREMGLAVLLPEYRSYGRSTGVPGEAAIVADFVAFHDRLVDRPEIDPSRVIYHGRSLGGGVVGGLAAERPPTALILESTFTNLPDLVSQRGVPMGAVSHRFDTRAMLMNSSLSTLILHGVHDSLIDFEHAVELHRVAWDARLVAFEAHHNDLPRGPAYWGAIRELLESRRVIAAVGDRS
ncbi:MAG: alpha/beta hydrolase [Sandaracinaceae bacterium]